MSRRKRALCWAIAILLVLLTGVLVRQGASFLVADRLEKADLILVLAGEERYRPARGAQLLAENYAPRLMLDVPSWSFVYNKSKTQLAQDWVATLPDGLRDRVFIVALDAHSTKREAQADRPVLQRLGCHSVLLVTSDFHARRALAIFQREIPEVHFGVTSITDPQAFGMKWWKDREWAKTFFGESTKFLWYEIVDRWRS